MRKAKITAIITAAVLAGALLAGCAGGSSDGGAANGSSAGGNVSKESGDTVEITFFHYLEQYQDQFGKLAQMYKEVKPNVDIKVEIIGADYDKILQTRVATGEVPDVFLSGPYKKSEMYSSVSYDLTNEPFVEDIKIGPEFKGADGALNAIPFTSQAWGILYNEEVFEKAGIKETPETLEELDAVCQKLQAAGVIPFAQGYKSDYVKKQLFGFLYAVDDNYAENIRQLAAKEKELKDFDFINKIFDCTELISKYTQPNPFDDDFAAAAARLGMGDAAMMTCGDWIVENARKANPDCKIGLIALPLSNDTKDTKVYVTDSVGLHVNKDAKHLDEVLEFVNWLVTSQETKDWMSNDMKALSAINGVSPVGSQVLSDALGYMNAGQTGTWASNLFPQGLEAEFTPAIDKFLLGDISRDEAIDEMNTAWLEFE